MKLVIVEDEVDARELLVLGMKELGHQCLGVATAREAQEIISHAFDAVALDILLPDVSGLDLLQSVRMGGFRGLCVMISSYADKEKALAALNRGADYFLEKPFSSIDLHRVLMNLTPNNEAGPLITSLDSFAVLTDREREFVDLLLRGFPNAEIARMCGIEYQSVKNALARIYEKMGVSSRGELFAMFLGH